MCAAIEDYAYMLGITLLNKWTKIIEFLYKTKILNVLVLWIHRKTDVHYEVSHDAPRDVYWVCKAVIFANSENIKEAKI